ncbi:MAG: methylmalonyl Co-A mutase-associated GTPase MeaB [Myxococcales bacterium]|nr:methylmalonyl Co-A mutase-associated GTPase MeaB [Myxococcales bacterium]
MTPTARAEAIVGGNVRLASRLMRDLDDEMPGADETLAALYGHTGRAEIIGITGNPGAGKSTLTDRLITAWRAAGLRVGVVAIDPSSPFTGGAILGDRVRMQQHATDSGVFIRSLATRGLLGGLSRSTRDVVNVLEAMGFERILIETVGVGQDEVDVAHTAHTTVVLTVPGLGDGVQALKAGLLEIADLFVVNKADRPEADQVIRGLKLLLELEGGQRHGWTVPISPCVATDGTGLDTVVKLIDDHLAFLKTTGLFETRQRSRRRAELLDRVFVSLRREAEARVRAQGGAEALVDALLARTLDPATAARRLLDLDVRGDV